MFIRAVGSSKVSSIFVSIIGLPLTETTTVSRDDSPQMLFDKTQTKAFLPIFRFVTLVTLLVGCVTVPLSSDNQRPVTPSVVMAVADNFETVESHSILSIPAFARSVDAPITVIFIGSEAGVKQPFCRIWTL